MHTRKDTQRPSVVSSDVCADLLPWLFSLTALKSKNTTMLWDRWLVKHFCCGNMTFLLLLRRPITKISFFKKLIPRISPRGHFSIFYSIFLKDGLKKNNLTTINQSRRVLKCQHFLKFAFLGGIVWHFANNLTHANVSKCIYQLLTLNFYAVELHWNNSFIVAAYGEIWLLTVWFLLTPWQKCPNHTKWCCTLKETWS